MNEKKIMFGLFWSKYKKNQTTYCNHFIFLVKFGTKILINDISIVYINQEWSFY